MPDFEWKYPIWGWKMNMPLSKNTLTLIFPLNIIPLNSKEISFVLVYATALLSDIFVKALWEQQK